MKRGLSDAIAYLAAFYPVALVPDELAKRANCDIMASTLAHSLRRARREGKVSVVYEKDLSGRDIAMYRAVMPVVNTQEPAVGDKPSANDDHNTHRESVQDTLF